MTKRIAAALLWYFAIWVGFEVVWSLTGIPRAIGPIVATAVSAFVGVDPAGLFWPRTAKAGRSLNAAERTAAHP
jgi:hypothetical protein